MKYAVLYESGSGNTEKVAGAVYEALWATEEQKALVDLKEAGAFPEADIYYIGFPVNNFNCSFRVMECLDKLQGKTIALFATCGLTPTEKYREKIESSMKAWIDDDTKYLGFFMCQGAVGVAQQQKMIQERSDVAEALAEMFEEGKMHPDARDLEDAASFVCDTQ